MTTVRDHAVVVGAGMAGLLAAAAVAPFYRSVSVVERDLLPSGPDHRNRFPDGFLVIADALCSLNPLYGQGMTMAAQQALSLRDCLRSDRDTLWQPFFAASARHIGPIWARNRSIDRVRAPTRSTVRKRVRRWPGKWLTQASLRAAATDVRVAEQILRVNNLVDPPSRLRSPMLLSRILIARSHPVRSVR